MVSTPLIVIISMYFSCITLTKQRQNKILLSKKESISQRGVLLFYVNPSFFLRSSSVPNSMILRFFTDFAPTLHRLWYGGRAKEQRTLMGGTLRKNRRIYVELSLPLLVKLVGIYEVMPDAVESADNGCDWIKENQSHPDDEYGIFLTECLTCCYC